MTGVIFSYALLAALATALLVASLTDLRSRRIANWLNASIALAAPLWWLAMGLGPYDIAIQLALAAATFTIACALFAMGQMGGGDVKLLAALALWFSPAPFGQLVIIMAVMGGGASLAMAALNMTSGREEKLRDLVAGAVTILWVAGALAIAFSVATGRPLLNERIVESLTSILPGFWAVPVIGIAFAALLLFGTRHIMRRQKSQIEVPYGIAIALASLWILGSQTLPAAQTAAFSS